MATVASMVPVMFGALALGGVAVMLARRRDLILRWCVWAVSVPVVVAFFWIGPAGIAVLASVVGVVAAIEFGALMQVGHLDRIVLAASVIAVVGTTWWAPEHVWRTVGIGMLCAAAAPLLVGDATDGLHRARSGVLGIAWLGPLAAMVPLGASALALFAAVSAADVVAYVTGPKLGGPRLSPLSPGKRWSGTVVGSLGGLGVLAALSSLSWPLAIAVMIGAPAGDLLESMVKRGVQAKDSGRWLAGAGGSLDRIDSLLIALAVVLVLQ